MVTVKIFDRVEQEYTDGFSRLLGIVRIDEHTAATDATTATATSATSERNRNYLGTVTSKAAANCGWWIEGSVLSRLPLLIPLRSLPHWTNLLIAIDRFYKKTNK
ncbi:hypothetical protein V1478_007387 [Vespula squamosa]|uniref:Ubiquitin-like protease family profile domain-containing protein n=1 Tax=Vespula squamosa TaxID=30214 RepID=A0ABD2B2Z4_VESSQ